MNEEIKNKDSFIEEESETTNEEIEKNNEEEVENTSINKEEIDFKSKYIELLANIENMRKRSEQERSELIKYRASSFIKDMLPGLDMLEASINSKNVSDEVKN